MRVLLTTDTIGGVWTFTRELTTELLGRQHDVSLLSFGRAASPEQTAWARQTAQRFPDTFRYTAATTPLEWMPENAEALSAALPILQGEIEAFGPDLLHSNQFCFGALPGSLPRIITAHSDVLSWAEACRPAGLEPSPWLAQYKQLVERGLAQAQAVTAPTQWMASALRKHFAAGPMPLVIANGRTLTHVDQPIAGPVQAVSAGRLWDEAKNTALLQAINAPMPIAIAGEQTLELSHAPDCIKEGEKRNSKLSFTGALREDALHALFRESSVYLATSIYEPFGLAPLEAALCGCAVLANDLPSLREVWGDAAMYFDGARSLEGSLHKLVDNPIELQTWRARAQARALFFTAKRMADAYLALYSEVLASASRRETAPPLSARMQEPAPRAV